MKYEISEIILYRAYCYYVGLACRPNKAHIEPACSYRPKGV